MDLCELTALELSEKLRSGEVLSGAAEVFADPDRRRAIERGLELLHPGDALLIAGKGHESTQQIGDVKHPFSDQQTVREILGCA